MLPRLACVLLLCAVCSGQAHGPIQTVKFGTQELEPELDSAMESPAFVGEVISAQCQLIMDCNVTCTLPNLAVTIINSTEYSCPDSQAITFTLTAVSDDAVIRVRLDAGSQLADGESLTVLEDGVEMAVFSQSREEWVASHGPGLTLEYQPSADKAGQIQLSAVAYNLTRENQTLAIDLQGVLDAPEQTNFTGASDYALNTERFWFFSLDANHINFTIEHLDLDPSRGDVLIIGSGIGPWSTEPVADLLTGKFATSRYHVTGGEAFVYFLSRAHSQPRAQFEISYEADPIAGTTTTVPTTTDRDHPPTPSDVPFQLDMYLTGIDPHRYLDPNDTAATELRETLAEHADFYWRDHNIPVWRGVHPDDIQFTSWLMCDYTSGWVRQDPNCVLVTWYIELLTVDGDWAFLEPDLRGIIVEYAPDINREHDFQVSLTPDEVNSTWWWAITIILAPVALIVFLIVMWLSTSSTKLRSNMGKNASIADSEEGLDEHMNNIDKEVRMHTEEKDRQMREIFQDDDGFQDYDPEIHPGAHRRRLPQPRLPQQPLKSALKAPRPPPAAYTNAAFEGDEGTPLSPSTVGGAQTFTLPDEPGVAKSKSAAPVAPVAAAAAAAAGATALPSEPASSELTEQLRLLNELNKTLKEEEKQAPGIELPRVNKLVQPATPGASKLYSMNDDGTGTEVADPTPGDNILQLDDNSNGSGDRKTSSV